jgi:hypothetical protein
MIGSLAMVDARMPVSAPAMATISVTSAQRGGDCEWMARADGGMPAVSA